LIDGLSIRGAVPSDAVRLAELSGVLGYPTSREAVAERMERLLARREEAVLVAESPSGHVIGWIHGSEQELLESGPRCEILGLVVDPECQGQGVGRRLIVAVEQWAARRGHEQIAVRSDVLRTDSHPFYERLGYTRAKTQHAYRKQLSTQCAV
jgi:GNAT superfamily N-acetyltransferase